MHDVARPRVLGGDRVPELVETDGLGRVGRGEGPRRQRPALAVSALALEEPDRERDDGRA